MTFPRILLCAALVASASTAQATDYDLTIGKITDFIKNNNATASEAQVIALHQVPSNPRYFYNLYKVDELPANLLPADSSSLNWGTGIDYPGSTPSHPVFKSTAKVPPSGTTATSARAELKQKWDFANNGTPRRWYAISVYIPDTGPFPPDNLVVGQLHTDQPSAQGASITVSPPVEVFMYQNYLNLGLNTSELTNDPAAPIHLTKESSSIQTIRLARIPQGSGARNKWYCFVMRADWSNTPGSGTFKIWMNKAAIYEATFAMNSYQSGQGNYAKTGAYLTSLAHSAPGTTYTMYNDAIYMGDENTSDQTVMYAKTPCANT